MSEAAERFEQLEEIRTGAQTPKQKQMAILKARFKELREISEITPDLYCAQLMDIVRDAEDKRIKELKAAELMEQKALASRAKAEGFSQMSSIVFGIVNKYIDAAKRDAAEIARHEAEEAEKVREFEEAEKKRLAEEEAARAEAREKVEAKKPEPAKPKAKRTRLTRNKKS